MQQDYQTKSIEIKEKLEQTIQLCREILSLSMKTSILFLCLVGSALAGTIKAIEPKVVNGTDADIAAFPSMISLRRNDGHSCGGTLLNEEWVLTVRKVR